MGIGMRKGWFWRKINNEQGFTFLVYLQNNMFSMSPNFFGQGQSMANFHIEALIPMSELEKLFALVHHL
jgi:hypothetical protein